MPPPGRAPASQGSASPPAASPLSELSERSPLLQHIDALVDGKPEELLSASPRVAVMTTSWPAEARAELEDHVDILAEGTLTFFGSPRWLVVVQLSSNHVPVIVRGQVARDGGGASRLGRASCAAEQLNELQVLLDDAFLRVRPQEGPWMWPLHSYKDCIAMINMASWENEASERHLPRLLRFLRGLSVLVPSGGSPVLIEIRDRYGASQAYSFSWSHAYVQMLWILSAIVGLYFCAGGQHPATANAPRFQWEVFKGMLVMWGLTLVISTWRQHRVLSPACWYRDEGRVRNPGFLERTRSENCWAALWFALGALPVLVLCILIVAGSLLAAIQFQAYLVWDWGDCIHLGCRDAQMKHGFWGWLLEVGSDVLVAVIFEGMCALSMVLGEWIARLKNHRLLHDYKNSVAMNVVILETIGKVLPYVFLAIVFVPQWQKPIGDPEADCSDLWSYRIIGESAFQCVRRRVPLERRREIFKLLMKGPFIVAPFIAILMKAIVPLVARALDTAAVKAADLVRWRWCSLSTGWVARLLGLIFSHDGESVACLRYIYRGQPFGPIELPKQSLAAAAKAAVQESGGPSPADVEDEEARMGLLKDGLKQGLRKPFEPLDELLELKLSFLWVLFFAPVMPIGVIPTLGARLLETRSDVTKMLLIRRRGFPEEAMWLHTSQRFYAALVLAFATLWSISLSLVTYNDSIWHWNLRWL